MTGMISQPNQGLVYWIEVNPRGEKLSLNAAPLRVGPMIEENIWHQKASVILTSATLTAHNEFQYLRNTLGADEADELQLGSPFDYESSTLLYVANDIPEPNVSGYQQTLDRSLIATAKATGGRMLVLFTSARIIQVHRARGAAWHAFVLGRCGCAGQCVISGGDYKASVRRSHRSIDRGAL